MNALQLIPPGSKLRRPLALLVLCGEVSLEVRTVALDPAVNGLLAPVCRQELTELAGDLLLAGDAKLRDQLGEVGEDGVVGPGAVSLTRAQNAAEAVAIGVHGLVLPCGRLRERNEHKDTKIHYYKPRTEQQPT